MYLAEVPKQDEDCLNLFGCKPSESSIYDTVLNIT